MTLGKKMEELNVLSSQIAESDSQNNITSSPNAAFVVEKVINNKIDSTLVKGEKSDEELLKGLLSDTYCYVCSSQLMFESHRLSHYEGKKHAQKVRIYLETVRAEKTTRSQQNAMTGDKNRFCELCNMVFTSHVVAKSHYEGKVHAKNLRKQSLHLPDKTAEIHSSQSLTQNPEKSDQKSTQDGDTELQLDLRDSPFPPASSGTEVDLKDPNKHCSLCAASFNNPQMALQHYNGRKHQRRQARQELLKELGDDVQQDSSLMCHMCGVIFNSVEMYQAHMQGNKHQNKEKKINDLFKSQPKVYSTFADELADYIQVQKARGIAPKTSQVLHQEGAQKGDEEEKEAMQEGLTGWNLTKTTQSVCKLPQNHQSPQWPKPGEWHPSYPGPPRSWIYSCPPPLHPGSTQFPHQPTKSGRCRRDSSSSTHTTSSYSSDSSHTSDSDESESRYRGKSRNRKPRRDRGGKGEDGESVTEEGRRKRQRREREYNEERRREPSVESEEEEEEEDGRRKKRRRPKEKKYHEENFEMDRGDNLTDTLLPEHSGLHAEAEMNADQSERRHDKPARPKYKKEKKKSKEKTDIRTEEEKLWDESILGC